MEREVWGVEGQRTKFSSMVSQDPIRHSPDMPVERTILDLTEQEKIGLVKIGAEVFHKLACKPGSYYLKEIA